MEKQQLKKYQLKKFYNYEYDVIGQKFGSINNKGWFIRFLIIDCQFIIALSYFFLLPSLFILINNLVSNFIVAKVFFLEDFSNIFDPTIKFIFYFFAIIPGLITILSMIPIVLLRTIRNVLFWSIIYFIISIFGILFFAIIIILIFYFQPIKNLIYYASILMIAMFGVLFLSLSLYFSAHNYQIYLESVISKKIHRN